MLKGQIKYCTVEEEHENPVPSCSLPKTTGQCFCRTNCCASAKSDHLETEGGGGQTEGGASPHPGPPHQPFQHRKDL